MPKAPSNPNSVRACIRAVFGIRSNVKLYRNWPWDSRRKHLAAAIMKVRGLDPASFASVCGNVGTVASELKLTKASVYYSTGSYFVDGIRVTPESVRDWAAANNIPLQRRPHRSLTNIRQQPSEGIQKDELVVPVGQTYFVVKK
jgi:hypothetical protein